MIFGCVSRMFGMEFTKDEYIKLIESIPAHITATISAKGGYTKFWLF